jgi:hypothetical protein
MSAIVILTVYGLGVGPTVMVYFRCDLNLLGPDLI